MERENEAMSTARSSDGGNAVVARMLYPLAPLYLTAASTPNERMPSWMEADATGWDASISVWWDYPPS